MVHYIKPVATKPLGSPKSACPKRESVQSCGVEIFIMTVLVIPNKGSDRDIEVKFKKNQFKNWGFVYKR